MRIYLALNFMAIFFLIASPEAKAEKNLLEGKKWTISYVQKENPTSYITEDGLKKEIFVQANPQDDAEKLVLQEVINKNLIFSIEEDRKLTCSELQKNIVSDLVNNLVFPFTKMTPDAYSMKKTKAGENHDYVNQLDKDKITTFYHLNFSWIDGPRNQVTSRGSSSIDFGYKLLECPDPETSIAEVSVNNVSIKNPQYLGIFGFGGIDMATIEIDWNAVENKLADLSKGKVVYWGPHVRENSKEITTIFNNRRSHRYFLQTSQRSKIEKRYKVEPKVVISRIQRALGRGKYDEANSRFLFTDKVKWEKSKYQNLESNISLVANIFPETGNSTAIVYDVEFQPIADTFTNENVFLEKDAWAYVASLLAALDKALM